MAQSREDLLGQKRPHPITAGGTQYEPLENAAVRARTLPIVILMTLVITGVGAATSPASADSGFSASSSVADGSTLSGTLVWTATAQGAPVKKIDFLIDGSLRWTENYAPYRYNGDPDGVLDTKTLSDGNHTLTVVAYTTTGQTATTKAAVTVANTAPSPASSFATSSSVADGSTLSGTLVWTATAQGAPVKKIDFLIDGSLRWTENYAPYRYNGDPDGVLDTKTLSDGNHTLTVVAYTTTGQTATTKAAVTVANTAPSPASSFATSSSVADGSTLSGTLVWTATAQGAPVKKIDFLIDGSLRWTENYAPYRYNGDPDGVLDTKTLSDGNHTLTVVAYTTTGQTATTKAAVTINNAMPVTFRGDYAAGTSTWQSTKLGGVQCLNYGLSSTATSARGTFQMVDDDSAHGGRSGRFDLPAAGVPNACELLRGRTIAMDDEWYSMEVRFPSDWREPSPSGWGMSLAQLNFENVWGAPVMIVAHRDHVDAKLMSGLCASYTSDRPGCAYSSGEGGNIPPQRIVPASDFSTGVGHQLLIHVRWTNGNDGLVEGFHRLRGESAWTRTASITGHPTLQRTSTFTPVAADRTVDKIGAYRGPADFPVSIWLGAFCQATSMAAAASCF